AGQVATPTATPSATPTAGPLGTTAAPLPQPTASTSPPLPADGDQDSGWLTWVLGAAALLVGAGLAWLFFRKRIGPARQPETPVVERPRAAPLPAADPAMVPEPAPIARAQPREPVQVTLIPVRMSLTLVNAVLNWEAELANHGSAPLTGLTIAADMISAHADLSVEDRNSGPAIGADSQLLGLLAPGEQRIAKGEIRLPFPHIVPIWHGEIALLMPLLRLRISADGMAPVTRIFLVGQPSPTDAATLQPFRLDLGPRVYPDLAQRIFA
ncbi:MAG: hypothetical protein WA842_11510, partial [Croceibacterium sp.]